VSMLPHYIDGLDGSCGTQMQGTGANSDGTYKTTRCHNQEDLGLNSHCHKNLNTYKGNLSCKFI
jgi:hypothetical protein